MENEITDHALQQILNFIDQNTVSAVITIDGKDIPMDFYDTRQTGDIIRKYVYLDDDELQGTITNARLVDSAGSAWVRSSKQLEKTQDGYMIVFPLSVSAITTEKQEDSKK